VPETVIIIGAGAAGLAAAGALDRAGIRLILLEGRERIGGRIYTIHPLTCAVPVELGAEFMHGRPAEIWEYVAGHRLSIEEVKGERCYFEDGKLTRADRSDARAQILAGMQPYTNPDRSFSAYLAEAWADLPESEKGWAVEYVEGFNAARQEEISVRSLAIGEETSKRQPGSGALYRISSGYDSLIGNLWADCARAELRLGTPVRSVRWQRGTVTAEADSGAFHGRCAIVTLPLGVLQANEADPGFVRFDPAPESISTAARRLRMGEVIRITFEFRHRFWEWGVPSHKARLPELSMIFSHDPAFPTWWTSEPNQAPVVTAWTSGARVAKLFALSPEQIIREAAGSIGRLFGVPHEKILDEIVNAHTHDWQSDPFSRGAYSYVPAGCVDDVNALTIPVEDTLFFAGEATHTGGRNGTVDGAIASGRRAADQVLEALRRR
jgi:monoamine oxidase